jgi:hypothetical protein
MHDDSDRRQIFVFLGVIGLGVLFVFLLIGLGPVLSAVNDWSTPLARRLKTELENEFDIAITVTPPVRELSPGERSHGAVTWDEADVADTVQFLKVLRTTLHEYPEALRRRLPPLTIHVTRDLRSGDFGRVGGVALTNENAICVDVEDSSSRRLRRTIHHEIYHLLDDRTGSGYYDPEWRGLNPDDFVYIGYGKRDRAKTHARAPPIGFISHYATASQSEDKAETFEAMMVSPRRIQERADDEPSLVRKMATIRERLRRFCPELPEGWPSRGFP